MRNVPVITLIYGKNSVLDAVDSFLDIETVYLARHIAAKHPKYLKLFKSYRLVSNAELDTLTKNANHQGFAATIREYSYYDFETIIEDAPEVVLILDHIHDPQNLGAIIRSANAFGVKHIIIPADRAASVTSRTIKVASGAVTGVKVIRVTSLLYAITRLKDNKFWVYASALNAAAKSLPDVKFNYPAVLIIGNEGSGVSKTVLNSADEVVFIPMKGQIQSLNAASATSVLLYALATKQ